MTTDTPESCDPGVIVASLSSNTQNAPHSGRARVDRTTQALPPTLCLFPLLVHNEIQSCCSGKLTDLWPKDAPVLHSSMVRFK